MRWNYMRLLEKQEIFWRQRAKDGDNNTHFFHKFASVRREHNKVKRLKVANGEWRETEDEIQDTIVKYFENIFLETDAGE